MIRKDQKEVKPMAQFCKECGEPIDASTRFCPSCGTKIEQHKGIAATAPTPKKPDQQNDERNDSDSTESTRQQNEQRTTIDPTIEMPPVPMSTSGNTEPTKESTPTKKRPTKKGRKIALILSILLVIGIGGTYAALYLLTTPAKKIQAFTEALENKEERLFSLVTFPEQTFYDKAQFFKEIDEVISVKQLQPKMEKAAQRAIETNTTTTVTTKDGTPFLRIIPTTEYARMNTINIQLATTKLELTTNEKKTKIQLGPDTVPIGAKPVIIGQFVRGTYHIPVTIDGKKSEPLTVTITGKERLQTETITK